MLCTKCKQDIATYHSHTNINGFVKEEHLCQSCARLKSNKFSFDIKTLIQSNNFIDVIDKAFAINDFNCGRYYGSSESILDQAKNSIKKGTRNFELNKIQEIDILKQKLTQAIEIEDYERASELKKEIDKLKNDD